ncbi:MAG: tocopherol cyclase family protein [Bacteroidales bacterium]|jgi:hypothetical protein|nr:tocopherol cyclase family protein [Bacteroidales bacterium]
MKSLYKIYHPELFQGSLTDRNYFEGWYFKHVSADTGKAFAVIAGISLSDDDHSFIQYIEGNSGKTSYFRYGLSDFIFSRKRFEVNIGGSFFSENGIKLDLNNNDYNVSGEISYTGINALPKSLLRPGIMGWYSFVPGMECNHGIVSTGHAIEGMIVENGEITDYKGGNGYTEKDWGISFPESWIWLQCNNFEHEDASIMISVAKIPWKGSWFMGLISFIRINRKIRILATYNGAKVSILRRLDESNTEVVIARGALTLTAVITKKGAGTLKAPSMGQMSSSIRESLNSEVSIELREGSRLLFSGKGVRAGYEETDRIFGYF